MKRLSRAGSGEAYSYEAGTLIVDLGDANTPKMVWRGTANKGLSEKPSPDERGAAVDEAIQTMLKKYPSSR
jgi:hypothetical protein